MNVYAVTVDLCGYVGDILFNGAPLLRCLDGVKINTVPVNQWVVHGENLLEVRLHAELPPSALPDPKAGYRLHVAVVQGTEQEVLGEDPLPALVQIPPLPRPMPALPFSMTATLPLAPGLPRWRWQDAEPIRLNEATVAELLRHAARMHQAALERDASWFVQHASLVFDEVPGAFGASAADARREFAELVTRTFARPSFAVEPFDVKELVCTLACGDRLVTMRTVHDEPVVRARGFAERGGWGVPFWLGKYEGKWTQLR